MPPQFNPPTPFTGLFLVVVLIALVSLAIRLSARMQHNSTPPQGFGKITASEVQVVAKRSETWQSFYGARTSYFVTFQLPSNERREIQVTGEQFGMLAENDDGTLQHRDWCYDSFIRRVG